MPKLSILIPSRNERYLQATISDILKKAAGDVEIITVLDGYWPDPPLKEDPRVIVIHRSEPRGMRDAINSAAAVASGDFLLKSDAHCLFGEGFDSILMPDCDDNTILIPRRKRLDAENWCIQDVGKPDVDYEYLSWPFAKLNEIGMHGTIWTERIKERMDIPLDENMSFQGSCWMMRRKHWQRIGGMDEYGYGRFVQEAQEIGLKTQLLHAGQILTSKKTYYCHWHKGKENGRGYYIGKTEMIQGTHWSTWHWLLDPDSASSRAKVPFSALIEKFNPPGWPTDWQEQARQYKLGQDGLLHKETA